ncbi:hypothetical protein D9619_002663 [Psilocybe cf. subviscida]|uniref:BHLH domain-containing protein n=1 Tax=Psilocybe cf. subviscida TaxID=2480587 RepID=A0A8H5AZS3_9AGAR|nr:hypothetical protein D9619_002663 [Psilocybe cf. subviscida]
MMEPMNDEAALANGYGFGYTQDQEASYAALNYGQHVQNYALQHPGATRGLVPDMQAYNPNVAPLGLPHTYGQEMYDPLSPPLSGSDTSADGIQYHSNSSGANSRSSSRGHNQANSLVHRTQRFTATPSPTSSSGRRRSRSQDSDDDDLLAGAGSISGGSNGRAMGMQYAGVENLANTRKEATRRQRIEAEQRRRDELREGYARLKDVLPSSNQKNSKVTLLERATNHIIHLEKQREEMLAKIKALEEEMDHVRQINEKIALGDNTPSPGRQITPPAEHGATAEPVRHSLASVRGQQPPSEHSSPSASEGGR